MRTLSRAVLALLAFLTLAALAAPAAAAQGQGESVRGTLIAQVEGEEEPVPVEGVVLIASQDGDEVGSATSGSDGTWEIELPGPGQYDVRLDVDSLPEGVEPRDPDRVELTGINVLSGQSRPVAFPLGEGRAFESSTLFEVLSLFVVGLKLGAIIALSAIGLSLIFSVTGLVNFAHAELVTIGAVVAYVFHAMGPQWPLPVAFIPAILVGAALGWGQEKGIWQPLRKRRMNLLTMLVVSIGLSFALRFLVLVFFGGRPRAYPGYATQGAIDVFGITVVPKHLVTIGIALVLLAAVGLFLQRTQAGTALRAVRDNRDLSESSGINVQRIIALTWVIGGALAAIGGVFIGLTESVQWDVGFRLLLLMFAAVILGGIGTAYGTMIGAFIVGIAVEMSVLWVPTELKNSVGLLVLIVMLIFRPQGLLGTKERIS
ncbi:MAG TPA: branched-chain amino acid ABC transporter permease [Jiangellaceae bacterium]